MQEKRMEELISLIKKYDEAYETGHPLISDTEYDKLYAELVELEKVIGQREDSPTTYIEDAKINHLKKVIHESPMLSQEKCHTADEIRAFVKRTNDKKYIVDLKLDGISIALKYKEGKLIQAVTRGNGHYGYDITAAAFKMSGVPKKLLKNMTIEVRGEVIMNEDDFEKLNTNGEYSNSRNFVAGTLNALDVELVRKRKLYVCTYDIRSIDGKLGQQMSTETAHQLLQELGFMVVKNWTFNSTEVDKMIKFCEGFNDTIRPTIECKIDGLVIKSNDDAIIEKLGNTSKFPKSSIAFKFDSQDRTTKLLSIDWQVGRTGQITPVANFETIEIDGVNISKASLANVDNIKKLDIKIGDIIVVARSNDVIPKIISVVKEKRNNVLDIEIPKTCPICGEDITKKGPLLFCTNPNCSYQLTSKLAHFASRDAMNIADLSNKTIEALIENGIPLYDFDSIYLWKEYRTQMEKIERFGEKKVDNLLTEIENSKHNYLHQLLYGLSIPNVGLSKAKAIASEYENLQAFLDDYINETLKDKLLTLPDFGEIVVDSIISWMDENGFLLLTFANIGEFPREQKAVKGTSLLSGKTIVITGELSISRREMISYLESFGINISDSVSSKTDYVLVGKNNMDTSSAKYKKAQSLNIPIIKESDIRELLK